MKYRWIAVHIAALLSACTGGDDIAVQTYHFVTPIAGKQFTFSETSIDNLNNTLTRTIVENISTVNADGSFVSSFSDPTGNIITSGTVDHTLYPTTVSYNNLAQETSSVVQEPNQPVSCNYDPNTGDPPSPLSAGLSWGSTYTANCTSDNQISYTRTGKFLDIESIVVPAGTFMAYKFQSIRTWTNSSGTAVVESITFWRNADTTSSQLLKKIVNYTRSGTAPPQGAIVSSTQMLQSYQ